MLWNVPIESLEERYSKDWNKWFPDYWDEEGIEYTTIYGERLTDVIETGKFLDVVDTNYFKASQLQQICKLVHSNLVHDGDVFFFHDLWFPGLEMLAYMRDVLKIKFKIMGIFHAGTYDPFDFLSQSGMGAWGKHIEEGWLQFVDKVFVATDFHKSFIIRSRRTRNNIYVTGLPIYDTFSSVINKDNIVVFPHRLDKEKQPEKFEELKEEVQDKYPDWSFIRTKDVCSSKTQYYELLSESKIAISFALQETWGIAMQEAVICGCIPIVPDRLSYKGMYDHSCKYFVGGYPNATLDLLHCRLLLEVVINNYDEYYSKAQKLREHFLEEGGQAIGEITNHLLG